jgi:hypothetical protein
MGRANKHAEEELAEMCGQLCTIVNAACAAAPGSAGEPRLFTTVLCALIARLGRLFRDDGSWEQVVDDINSTLQEGGSPFRLGLVPRDATRNLLEVVADRGEAPQVN